MWTRNEKHLTQQFAFHGRNRDQTSLNSLACTVCKWRAVSHWKVATFIPELLRYFISCQKHRRTLATVLLIRHLMRRCCLSTRFFHAISLLSSALQSTLYLFPPLMWIMISLDSRFFTVHHDRSHPPTYLAKTSNFLNNSKYKMVVNVQFPTVNTIVT